MQHFIRVCTILFAKTKSIFRVSNTIFVEIITCEASIYTMDHPILTISNIMGNSIVPERVNVKLVNHVVLDQMLQNVSDLVLNLFAKAHIYGIQSLMG